MKYSLVPLGEICDFIYGDGLREADRNGGDVPVYGSNGIVGWHDEAITKGETIIVGRKGSIGEVHLSKIPCWAIDTTYYIDKTKVPCDFTWLYYTLKALDLTRLNKSAAVPGLNREDAYEQKTPLPPLNEQKRIASLLARADRLRQLRRTAHDLGDALLQSVFLEMFYNTKNKWELSAVEDLAKKKNNAIRTGPFGSQLLHSEFTETGEVLVLGIDNAVQNEFSWGKPRFITREKYEELKRYTVFPGDLLVTIMATNGRIAVVPDNIPLAINTKHLCCITLDQTICLPKFLHSCLLYHPSVLKQMGVSERGAVMPGLNMEIIKNLVVPVPPLSLQEEFAGVVARVEGLRGRMVESTRQVEGLFEALLNEAFHA